MTLDEFRAWLRGYQESFAEDGPDTEQWEKILKELGEVQTAVPATCIPYIQNTPYRFPLNPPWTTPWTPPRPSPWKPMPTAPQRWPDIVWTTDTAGLTSTGFLLDPD